jgi:hypothetical protein
LLPLLAATWAFSEVAQRGERGGVDSRLSTALRVATHEYAEQVDEAAQAAHSLARATSVQRALLERDRSALVRTSRDVPHSAFYSGEELLAGETPPELSVVRDADVVTSTGETIGRVVVFLPLDDGLVRALRVKSGL